MRCAMPLCLALVLAACGQSGDLYLPDPKPAPAPEAQDKKEEPADGERR